MRPYIPWFFVLLFLLLDVGPVFPQQIFFNKVLPPEGKTFRQITGIVQDEQGYMWFATKGGLYRYNGYAMSSYRNNPSNPNSLGNNALTSMCIDSSGLIWVGTFGSGLDRLEPSTGIFTHFHHDAKDPGSLSNDTVICLLADHQGLLWIGTNGGLDRLEAKTGKFIHYRHAANDITSISCDQIEALYEDHQGTLWVGTGDPYPQNGVRQQEGGLNRFDKKVGKFIRYLHNPKDPHSLINNKVGAFFEDSKGTFWVGTAGDGLHAMDRLQGTFERYPYDTATPVKLSRPPRNKDLVWDHITFIKADAAGGIWIGTAEAGLNYHDPKTGRTVQYGTAPDTTGAFADKQPWWAFTSHDGVLWIGTMAGNLYHIDPFQRTIPRYASPGPVVETFLEEADALWIGTEKGLFRKDLTNGIVKRYMHDPFNLASLGNNYIQHILKDRQGNIWIATHDGLDLLNKDTETFTHYRHNPKNSNSLSSDSLGFIYEDPEAKLWIGTGNGLNLMDRKTGTFTPFFLVQRIISSLVRITFHTFLKTGRENCG